MDKSSKTPLLNLSMIACVSQDGGLGYQGQLLWNIPEDMAFFRRTTMGHPVVMGSTTYASIGRPLPGRENIVLSRRDLAGDIKVFHAREPLDAYLATKPDEVFIIGGASLYAAYLPLATTLYLTEVAATRPADVFFPDFDRSEYHRQVLKTLELDGVRAEIVKYTKK